MSTERDARWYLKRDRAGLVREVEARLDAITLEAHGLSQLRHAEIVAGLERLGLHELAARCEPPPPLHRGELYDSRWPTDADVYGHRLEREAVAGRRGQAGEVAPLGEGAVVVRTGGSVLGVL